MNGHSFENGSMGNYLEDEAQRITFVICIEHCGITRVFIAGVSDDTQLKLRLSELNLSH
jgi:hypothetical protein